MSALYPYLTRIHKPGDVRAFRRDELPAVADEMRRRIIEVVASNGGHLGSNLGTVELTLALQGSALGVEAARQHHRPVHGAQLVSVHVDGEVGVFAAAPVRGEELNDQRGPSGRGAT